MKIIIVNRNYFITGGPEKYMFSIVKNMPQHQFVPFCVDFEQNLETPYRKYFVSPPSGSDSVYFNEFKLSTAQKIAYAWNSVYHHEARRKLEQLINDERPDLALFLNAVYFSDSIIDACRAHRVPIIWRMSDFHKVCANYLLYRDGHVCEDCLVHGLARAIRNRCGGYQRSLGAAFIKVAGMSLSRVRRLYDHVEYFVTPSAFTREKMIQGGFNPKKIVHIPTMITVPEQQSLPMSAPPEILYVGRLSHEKGVDTLLEAFKLLKCKDACLSIAGDDASSYAQQLKASVPDDMKKRIAFLGFQNQDQIAELFKRAAGFVVPSVCYENQPNVVLEGMSHSRPAIVSDLGSLREMVIQGKTGYRFEAGNPQDLADKMDDLFHNLQKAHDMGILAREYVVNNHTSKKHISSLEDLFVRCVKGGSASSSCGLSKSNNN